MKLNLLLFASVKEIVGSSIVEMELGDGATLADLADKFYTDYPAAEPLRGSSLFAVNQEIVKLDIILADGDEIALIPPVSGG